jgi:hypothetical protein
MHRFGVYKATPTQDRNRESYRTLFETIFQPYFKSNLPEDVAERRADLNEVFDAAAAHGMESLSTFGDIDYQWGEKKDLQIELAPAMTFANGRGKRAHVIAQSSRMY